MKTLPVISACLLISAPCFAAPKIVCDAPDYDFGVRRDNEVVVHQFVIGNDGDAPLAISRVKASCGCTAVESSTSNIAPGAQATIDARFSLRGRHGLQRKSILIESNDPENPRLRLWLKGEIVIELALDPRYLNFNQMSKDRVTTQQVTLVSLRPDIRITNVTSKTSSYTATIDPDGRGLTIRSAPPLEKGLVRGYMSVATDHPLGLTADLNIVGVAVSDLTVVPTQLTLRESWPDARRLTLVVRPFAGDAFKITGVDVPLPSISTSVTQQPNSIAHVVLENVRPDSAMDGKAIVLHTDLKSCPELRVPIRILP